MRQRHCSKSPVSVPERKSRKWAVIVLCAGLMLSLTGNTAAPVAFAAEESAGLCPHHTAHDASCGWQPGSEGSPCTHVHDASCGYAAPQPGAPCTHVHDASCGYTAPAAEIPCDKGCTEVDAAGNILHEQGCAYTPATAGTPCTHVHDESCGYTAPQPGSPCTHAHDASCGYAPAAEGSPCTFRCGRCVTAWAWEDEEGALSWDGEAGMWCLGLPGASEAQPVTAEALQTLLPSAVTVETAAGSKQAPLQWALDDLPGQGVWEGEYTLRAALPAEYLLTDGVQPPAVRLELGGGQPMAGTIRMKFLNQWNFIGWDGEKITDNSAVAVVTDLSKGKDAIIAQLKQDVLPKTIRGWVTWTGGADVFNRIGFTADADQSEKRYEMGPNGLKTDDEQYNTNTGTFVWGRVNVNWELKEAPAELRDGSQLVFWADPNTVREGDTTYALYVNSNNPLDYYPNVPDSSNPEKDTRNNPGLLSFTITLRVVDLSTHTVAPAAPQNVKVNLFDYWVRPEGESPTAPQGDILDKSDSHQHENSDDSGALVNATGFSNATDWDRGINHGHLLLFGDGLIHAGLWNKGAGETCRYGREYAGMEGIVKSVLPESGYPELNLEAADWLLTAEKDNPAHNDKYNTEQYKLIRDWNLTGDHIASGGDAYNSLNVQNLSTTAIERWEAATGQLIETGTESLQYLFEPVDGPSKKAYENVTGLFQIDNEGYYYYDMRQNFAEFSQSGGNNHFILYRAPATVRTDAAASIGNFFPFNKGSEVFTGLDGDDLTSSVNSFRNTMNHHLGMTVDVDFRQPVNGRIGSGTNAKPMTFEFSGDDDVWVFIDNVLVLDLGGIHSEIYGTINFETGAVCIGRSFYTNGIPDNPEDPTTLVTKTTLRQLFEDAQVVLKDSDWNGDTFASNTTHTLKMFYLERGNYDSSIALRFNLQPLLYQNIAKVDQNGTPLPGVDFYLYPATRGDTGAIQCLYTDNAGVGQNDIFYVTPDVSNGPLVTLTTDEYGSAVFHTPEGGYFNFADLGDQYYVLREASAPQGYRTQPVDIALHYDAQTSMLSVANRWTTGAYACSVSNITGPQQLYYAGSIDANGQLEPGTERIPRSDQRDGLVIAVPLLKQRSTGAWMALYGSNLTGFGSVKASGGITDWRGVVLEAALQQAAGENYTDWHLDWDDENTRLYGRLNDLPGLAGRYLLNDPAGGDMQMVYGIIPPAALRALGINEDTAAQRYAALRNYVQRNGVNATIAAIRAVGSGDAFRLISVVQFNRNFRSLIFIPNERRELRVLKIDQDGNPVQGARFGLFDNEACTGTPAATGVTDAAGTLIFSPTGDSAQQGQARMVWANSAKTQYYLKEMAAPPGFRRNGTVTPVVVGTYGIYADAGTADNGISVVADVGRLTQTMRQFAMGSDVDVTLRDITAFMQVQPSGRFEPDGWQDAALEGTNVARSMNLHFERNAFVDYGLHDQDGGEVFYPFFVTDTGFVRTRIQQNYAALTGGQYDPTPADANRDNLGDTDLTNLFSLLNMVVVTDKTTAQPQTGALTIGKQVTGSGLTGADYTKLFAFTVNLTDANGTPLSGSFDYYFYGEDKAGKVSNGETLLLHHDEYITILGLPAGTRLTVTEGAETGWYVRPQSGIYTGVITPDGDFEAIFTNAKTPFPQTGFGSLTVRKTVTGLEGDRTKSFDFSVRLTEGSGTFTHDGVSYTLPCTVNFSLRDGEQETIENLPAGAAYVVTESGNEGYDVTKTGDTGMIVDGVTSTADFVNHKGADTAWDVTEVPLHVEKVWVLNDGGRMSESVTVVLYQNGVRYDTAELNAGNGWAYTWDSLDDSFEWTVEELNVPEGFTASVSRCDGLNFTVTNDDIPGAAGANSPIPRTGVSWALTWLLAAAGVLLLAVGIGRERRGKNGHESQHKAQNK